MNTYKDLIVWQRAVELVLGVYTLTDQFPKREWYGLSSQMRRASVSICSNIAEGFNRSTRKDFRHFLFYLYGSGAELETQIHISKSLSLCREVDYKQVDALLNEVMRMLNKLTRTLKNSSLGTSY